MESLLKRMNTMLLVSSAVGTALMAGLFFAYSCSVNPGLHSLSDSSYLEAMQAINRAILNPTFLLCFLGTAVWLPFSCVLNRHHPGRMAWLLAASICYGVGVLGVTLAGNVPLNEALASFDLRTANPEQLAHQRLLFEVPWNQFHTIRTIAAILTELLVVLALLQQQD